MKATIQIALQPNMRVIRLERVHSDDGWHDGWRFWTNANLTMTQGTYIMCYDNGSMERVTLHEDGHEDTFLIKPAE